VVSLKVVYPLKIYQNTNISWSYVDWCKSYIYLKSLNICHFGKVAATALKIMVLRSPSMARPPY
jgi:hypothetical protein